MALGGIPVSGGVAGNGTLLGTNLLREPLIWTPSGYVIPAYTLGGTTGATGYEAKYVKDGDPKTIFKTAASSSEQTLTMIHGASPPTVYGIAVVGHNMKASEISLAKFEGGNDTDYDLISADLVLNADTLTPAFHLLASPQAYDHWRIRVQFSSSKSWEMGEVFLIGSAPLSFERNYSWRGKVDEELGESISEGTCGIRRRRILWTRFWREFHFDRISQAQYDALSEIARNGYCIFSPEGANGKAYLGDIEKEPASDEFVDQLSLVMRFTEVSK